MSMNTLQNKPKITGYDLVSGGLRFSEALQIKNPVNWLKLRSQMSAYEPRSMMSDHHFRVLLDGHALAPGHSMPKQPHISQDMKNNDANYKKIYVYLVAIVCAKAQANHPIYPEDHKAFSKFMQSSAHNGIHFRDDLIDGYLDKNKKMSDGAKRIFQNLEDKHYRSNVIKYLSDFNCEIKKATDEISNIDQKKTERPDAMAISTDDLVLAYQYAKHLYDSNHIQLLFLDHSSTISSDSIIDEEINEKEQVREVLLHAQAALIRIFENFLRHSQFNLDETTDIQLSHRQPQ